MKSPLLFLCVSLWSAFGCSAAEDAPLGGAGGSGGANAGSPSGGGTSANPSGGSAGMAGTPNAGGSLGFGGAAGSAAGGSAASIGGSGSGGTSSGGSGGSAPLDRGLELYGLNCAKCHGEQGAGSLLAPDIKHPVRDYSTWVVRNGRAQTTYAKPMEKWGTDKLSDADLTLIFDYLDKPPQPTTGQALFLDYCANCHGADAMGSVSEHNLRNELDKIKTQPRMGAHPGEYTARNKFMPVFTPQRISDAELTLIHDYVDSL